MQHCVFIVNLCDQWISISLNVLIDVNFFRHLHRLLLLITIGSLLVYLLYNAGDKQKYLLEDYFNLDIWYFIFLFWWQLLKLLINFNGKAVKCYFLMPLNGFCIKCIHLCLKCHVTGCSDAYYKPSEWLSMFENALVQWVEICRHLN